MPHDLTDDESTLVQVNTGSGSGLLPDGTKPLPEPVLTKISNAIWRH